MRLFFCLLLLPLLSGCLATGVSKIESDPDFNWDTLKRDQILMSPLVDLRPGGGEKFFTDKERFDYPEAFKQVFFKLRKDIRVFGAGGAFQNMAQLAELPDVARKVLAKDPLSDVEAEKIKAGTQEIRFVFFFAVTNEHLSRDYSYEFRSDQRDDVARYVSRRELTVKLALWDSTTNKTVWLATENLTPQDVNTVSVPNPTKRRVKRGDRYVWVGTSLYSSLAKELQIHPGSFPAYPGREPAFSRSFDDFALALPLQPSEAKLIEYEHFTYHRPEADLSASQIGKASTLNLYLGYSAAIHYHWRIGGGLAMPLGTPTVRFQGEDYTAAMVAYGLTADYEWELGPRTRLLTGLFAGGAGFTLTPAAAERTDSTDSTDPDGDQEDPSIGDGAFTAWPRARVLFGDKGGFQWGVGGAYRFFDGIEEPLLKQHRPAPWNLEAFLGFAFRGF